MGFEFDKEIDILLRQTARLGDATAEIAGAHPDADEINAFAENALSEKSRLRAMEHFADCARCRKVLSDLAVFKHETESEIVHQSEEKTISAITEIAWYKKLFMFPQIAYAMGALALIFGGIIAVVVLKDSAQNYSSDFAKAEEQSESPSIFSGGSSANSNANMMSSAAANYSNSTAMSNAASSANSNSMTAPPTPEAKTSQPTNAANLTVAESQDKLTELAKPAPQSAGQTPDDEKTAVKEKRDNAVTAPPASPKKENNYSVDGTDRVTTTDSDAARQQSEPSQNQTPQNQSSNQTQIMPNSRSVQNLPMVTRRVQKSREEEALSGSSANAGNENKPAETKSLGGRNFRRADGVWYDVNYRSQPTINVRRNSNEYKKLDSNLRSIADRLGGVVVIVSGNKAYRIQ